MDCGQFRGTLSRASLQKGVERRQSRPSHVEFWPGEVSVAVFLESYQFQYIAGDVSALSADARREIVRDRACPVIERLGAAGTVNRVFQLRA